MYVKKYMLKMFIIVREGFNFILLFKKCEIIQNKNETLNSFQVYVLFLYCIIKK